MSVQEAHRFLGVLEEGGQMSAGAASPAQTGGVGRVLGTACRQTRIGVVEEPERRG